MLSCGSLNTVGMDFHMTGNGNFKPHIVVNETIAYFFWRRCSRSLSVWMSNHMKTGNCKLHTRISTLVSSLCRFEFRYMRFTFCGLLNSNIFVTKASPSSVTYALLPIIDSVTSCWMFIGDGSVNVDDTSAGKKGKNWSSHFEYQ